MAILDWFHSSRGSQPHSPHGQGAEKGRSGALPPVTLILKRGASVTADFSHGNDVVHTLCRVEKYSDATLSLRVISELGKVPMIGLKVGTVGQFEANNQIFPFHVTRVALPVIDVTVSLTQARPVKRQFLRVPVSVPIRLRPSGSPSPWITGKSLDLSAGGCAFAFSSPHLPSLGSRFDLDMTVDLSPDESEQLAVTGEVRWVKRVAGAIHVGIEVHHPAQRRILAAVVSRLQQTMSRHPDDYLLT